MQESRNRQLPFLVLSPSGLARLPEHHYPVEDPHTMRNSHDFDSQESFRDNVPRTSYIPDYEDSQVGFSEVPATPPPNFNPLMGSEPLSYAHGFNVDHTIDPAYTHHLPYTVPNAIPLHEDWHNLVSQDVNSIINFTPDILSHQSDIRLSIPPTSPASGGSPSPSTASEFYSTYDSSPMSMTPNPAYGTLPDEASQEHVQQQMVPTYPYRDQLQFFKDVLDFPMPQNSGPFIPQPMYRPHTDSDRRRYVEQAELEAPLYFWLGNSEIGIPLSEALHGRTRRLLNRDDAVLVGRGPSISIRLEWPGYSRSTKQIPTRDFRSPPGPITMGKLAKGVAKCVKVFLDASGNCPLEEGADRRWKIGRRANEIKLEDLVLVSMHHVSMGSWQPHLRLLRPQRFQ